MRYNIIRYEKTYKKSMITMGKDSFFVLITVSFCKKYTIEITEK